MSTRCQHVLTALNKIEKSNTFKQYQLEIENLKTNPNYQQLLIDLQANRGKGDQYHDLKQQLRTVEYEVKKLEQEINHLINLIIGDYNQFFYKSELEGAR